MPFEESKTGVRRASDRIGLVVALTALTGIGAISAQTPSQSGSQSGAAPAGQSAPAAEPAGGGGRGRGELPIIPGLPWRIHDMSRPRPPVVTPGLIVGAPPSDAIVLFNGKDLSQWTSRGGGPATWRVRDGYFETGAGSGSISTRESFGDVQLHLEWAAPVEGAGSSPSQGNSGVIMMGLYEIQILDSYNSDHYPDGQAAAIYGEWPPLVNVARKPGEWQTFDIVFEAPRFNGTVLIAPAYYTLVWNGVIAHNRRAIAGPTAMLTVHQYKPHAAELPLQLQDHAHPVKFRNVWIRRLGGYDLQK
jgi:hypothetical protein